MQDLTTIDKPFGLLDKETQERLKAHGGPYELYCYLGKWVGINVRLSWMPNEVYRVKPQPEPKAPEKPEAKVGSLWRFSDGSFKGYAYELLSLRPDGSVVLMAQKHDDILHVQRGEFEVLFAPYTPPRKCEAWVNVYADGDGCRFGPTNYANEQNARDEGSADELYIATVRIEYVESKDDA